jgi:hypothetical protein
VSEHPPQEEVEAKVKAKKDKDKDKDKDKALKTWGSGIGGVRALHSSNAPSQKGK